MEEMVHQPREHKPRICSKPLEVEDHIISFNVSGALKGASGSVGCKEGVCRRGFVMVPEHMSVRSECGHLQRLNIDLRMSHAQGFGTKNWLECRKDVWDAPQTAPHGCFASSVKGFVIVPLSSLQFLAFRTF